MGLFFHIRAEFPVNSLEQFSAEQMDTKSAP